MTCFLAIAYPPKVLRVFADSFQEWYERDLLCSVLLCLEIHEARAGKLMIDYLDTHHWVRSGTQGDKGLRSVLPRLRDLRRAPRSVISASAMLIPMDDQVSVAEPVPVTLRDVSRFGLGLVSTRVLEPDSNWRVEFMADARRLGQHLVSVRHCKPIQSAYLAGVQFCAAPDLLDCLGFDGADAAAA